MYPISDKWTFGTCFDMNIYIWTNGVINPRTGISPGCCGTWVYDLRFSICCNGVINPRTGISPAAVLKSMIQGSIVAVMGGYRQAAPLLFFCTNVCQVQLTLFIPMESLGVAQTINKDNQPCCLDLVVQRLEVMMYSERRKLKGLRQYHTSILVEVEYRVELPCTNYSTTVNGETPSKSD